MFWSQCSGMGMRTMEELSGEKTRKELELRPTRLACQAFEIRLETCLAPSQKGRSGKEWRELVWANRRCCPVSDRLTYLEKFWWLVCPTCLISNAQTAMTSTAFRWRSGGFSALEGRFGDSWAVLHWMFFYLYTARSSIYDTG